MDAKTKTKMVNALMTRFIKLYEQNHDNDLSFNRNTSRWGFGYMLEDLGAQAMPVLEYYFTLRRNHSTYDLLDNYQDFKKWMAEDEKDEQHRRRLREATKRKVEEQDNRWQQKP